MQKMEKLAETVDLHDTSKTPDGEELDAVSVYTWFTANGGDEMDLQVISKAVPSVFGASIKEVSFLFFIRCVKSAGECDTGRSSR